MKVSIHQKSSEIGPSFSSWNPNLAILLILRQRLVERKGLHG